MYIYTTCVQVFDMLQSACCCYCSLDINMLITLWSHGSQWPTGSRLPGWTVATVFTGWPGRSRSTSLAVRTVRSYKSSGSTCNCPHVLAVMKDIMQRI